MRCWTTSATSPRPAVDPVGSRAGFTIIELLVVIGIVLAVGAVSLPFTLRQFEKRSETEAIDRFGLLVRMARSESRSTGIPLEVRCDASGRRIFVLRVDPRDPPTLEVEAPGSGFELQDAEDPDRRLFESWSIVELPSSLSVVPAPEEGDSLGEDDFDPIFESARVSEDDSQAVEEPWPEATRLLLLVPDGTTISIEDFGIRSPDGWRRLRVDPWTAVMTFESRSEGRMETLEVEETTEEVGVDPESEGDSQDPDEPSVEPDIGGAP